MSEYPQFYWSSRDESLVPENCEWGVIGFNGQANWLSTHHLSFQRRLESMDPSLRWGDKTDTTYAINFEQWSTCVRIALDKIASGELQKVVLAQRKTLKFDSLLNPFQILARLKQHVPNAYHFCYSDAPHRAFLGASPERLYARRGRLIETEAQAGTRRRGTNRDEDELLKRELETSEKDHREHEWVQRELVTALSELCEDSPQVGACEIVQLPNVQHLRSRISGQLKEGVTDADILALLHPTPAVCGVPREKARETILSLEPFDRRLYAGAIGYRSEEAAEFAVGIRSAFVEGNKLHVMAGAGIVAGSNAQDEWTEIENKMSIFNAI